MTEQIFMPFEDLVNRVLLQLEEQHYMESTLIVYKRTYRKIKKFMLLNGYQEYGYKVGLHFVNEQKAAFSTVRAYKCAIRRLNDSLSGKEFRSHHENNTVKIRDNYRGLLDEYLNDCIKRGNKPGTITHKRYACVIFLNILSDHGYSNPSLINADIIARALLGFTNMDRYAEVKQLLKYIKEKGLLDKDYDEMIPRHKRPKPIPSVYSINELKLIEHSVDVSTDIGKRNIAIIKLATRMGFRSGDIAKLRISEINFSSETIRIIQEKTNIQLELQMPIEVSDSIYIHLENSKKNHFSDGYVFHSMTAPYGRITTSIIRHLVNDYINKAGIKVGLRKHGPHTFRSSLASHMIEDENSYETVRRILGHSDPNVIKHYAKTDIEKLRLCAISPPKPGGLFEDYLSGRKVISRV